MNNGADLNTKIEELKQLALKSGNTFVVDMINSNKNHNDLFLKNMSKMMNKGGDGEESKSDNKENDGNREENKFNDSENDNNGDEIKNSPDKVDKTLILKKMSNYDIFKKYNNDFKFLFEFRPKDTNDQYYNKIEINTKYLINNYLLNNIKNLFDNTVETNDYYNSELPDIKYIDMLLNKSNEELKTKISTIITSSNGSIQKKLGNKIKDIVLKYKVFIRLIKYIDENINIDIKYEDIDDKEVRNLYLNYKNDNNLTLNDIKLIEYDKKSNSVLNNDDISNKISNNIENNNYQNYLLDVIMGDLLFSNDNDLLKILNPDVKNTAIIDFIEKKSDALVAFILTTCLFIGKELNEGGDEGSDEGSNDGGDEGDKKKEQVD